MADKAQAAAAFQGAATGTMLLKATKAAAKAKQPANATGSHGRMVAGTENDGVIFLPGRSACYDPTGFFAVNCGGLNG
jgi:hypothetical protein